MSFVFGFTGILHFFAPLNWPYDYYFLLRFATTIASLLLLYKAFVDVRVGFGLTAIVGVFLWSPFFWVEMAKEEWLLWNLGYAVVFFMAALSFWRSSNSPD